MPNIYHSSTCGRGRRIETVVDGPPAFEIRWIGSRTVTEDTVRFAQIMGRIIDC